MIHYGVWSESQAGKHCDVEDDTTALGRVLRHCEPVLLELHGLDSIELSIEPDKKKLERGGCVYWSDWVIFEVDQTLLALAPDFMY